jgi:perosamine synthetase
MKDKFIPWTKPNFWGNEIKYVTDALESTWISGGQYLDRLEADFSKLLEHKHVLAVSNGTTAIHLAYLGLRLEPGDEVIVPGFAFMAAANVAIHMDLKPVFAEVDPDTWCLSAQDLPKYISSKTRAIVPVHTYGNVCAMDEIMEIAKAHNIAVIEDCAESLFSKYKGRESGTIGDLSTYSLQATKMITTGEGGLVVTSSDELKQRMMLYRSHGMDRGKKFYWHELPGHNFRLTNFQAAIGVAQLEQKDAILAERHRVYEEYKKHLLNTEGITFQKINSDVNAVIWAIALKLDNRAFPQGRDEVIEQLRKVGIETRPGFYASSILKIYEPHSLPVCENISKQIISVPTFSTLTNEDIEYISEQLLKLIN